MEEDERFLFESSEEELDENVGKASENDDRNDVGDILIRVYYPSNLSLTEESYIMGWRYVTFLLCSFTYTFLTLFKLQ